MDRLNEELGKKMGGAANLRIEVLEGDMGRGYVSLGNRISHIHEIMSTQEIVDELTADYRTQQIIIYVLENSLLIYE